MCKHIPLKCWDVLTLMYIIFTRGGGVYSAFVFCETLDSRNSPVAYYRAAHLVFYRNKKPIAHELIN